MASLHSGYSIDCVVYVDSACSANTALLEHASRSRARRMPTTPITTPTRTTTYPTWRSEAVTAVEIPRPEHPRPQFHRPQWLNLNGIWDFERDRGDSGLERGMLNRPLIESIMVPFAPEAIASGIGDTDFLEAVWYRREFDIPTAWSGRILLHFGAVDYDTTVWIGIREVGRHRGGFASFSFDITQHATPGKSTRVTVRARDPRSGSQARGKQATWYHNSQCYYTRTTGIWQTVWLEHVGESYLESVRVTPQLGSGAFDVEPTRAGGVAGTRFHATLLDADGGELTAAEADLTNDNAPRARLTIPSGSVRTWSPGDPYLYGLRLELIDAGGTVVDTVHSYAGLRSITIESDAVLLNGQRIFQRLVLDQGYWPNTLMTAPSDAALERDIRLGLDAGFNGARLHQKVFEERYLYHADRLGYLLWGEFGDWGASGGGPETDNQHPTTAFVAEWLEVLRRDRNHPAIIGWCPLNETHQIIHDRETGLDDITRAMYLATKLADPTRPVIDASGYSHRVRADIYDSHSYEQDPERFGLEQSGLAEGKPFTNDRDGRAYSIAYDGQPYFVSEYGGIWWRGGAAVSGDDLASSWGYGQRVADLEEFYARFAGLTRVLLRDPGMFGYCYTQLTDVFQEHNGLYAFDRSPKFDTARIRAVQQEVAAFERVKAHQ